MTDPQIPPAVITEIRARHERATHPDWRPRTDVGRLLAELDRVTAELAALREATCPRCEGCDQPMPEPNAAGWWWCAECGAKAQAYWATQPEVPF